MEDNQEEFTAVDGTRATPGPTSEGTSTKKKDHILQRIQPTNAAGLEESANGIGKTRHRSESLAACQNLYQETTARIETTLEQWKDKEEQILPDDETRLRIDYLQMKSDQQEMDRLANNLIKLFNDKGSLQEAKVTAEATEALHDNVVRFKNWCRTTLGPASRTPSVSSVRSSIRSSVHSSASSAERKRNAAADAAAAKARMVYEKEALELENEVALKWKLKERKWKLKWKLKGRKWKLIKSQKMKKCSSG